MATARKPRTRRGDHLIGAHSQFAFTMLELLVVVAVLVLLAALLFPAVARARDKAHRVDCLSRMKQWNVAFTVFAEENDGWIARECYEPLGEVTINNWSQVRGNPLPGGGTDSADVWYNALPPELSQRPAIAYAPLPQRRQFFDRRLLIHCPSAGFPAHTSLPTYQFPLFSIAMNSQIITSSRSVQWAAIESADAARTAIFLDNRLEGEAKVHPAQEDAHLGQPGAYANRFGARHDGGGNIAFADGHVAWFRGRDVVETDTSSPLAGGPILPPRDIVWELYSP